MMPENKPNPDTQPARQSQEQNKQPSKVPVTVLTGFLGSGKTTLLNRILTENHGKRIAVIENEFGEIGIDDALVVQSDEEIFEMNNGCICCTVRGDLIRILGNLMRRRDRFDYILVETTGLADPAPVAQTFFVDDEVHELLELDGIVTVIDSKHVFLHLESSPECKEQIAFADVILLNKIDLVSAEELNSLEERIRAMNAMAKIFRSQDAAVDMENILNVKGFDLNRALAVKPTFLQPEYPFEWVGQYELDDSCKLELQDGPDPSMNLLIMECETGDHGKDPGSMLSSLAEQAMRRFSHEKTKASPGDSLDRIDHVYELGLTTPGTMNFTFNLKKGIYALFTQHRPDEFQMSIKNKADQQELKPLAEYSFEAGHSHDNEVSSVGIECDGDINHIKFNEWLGHLLREKGTDIFRMKGIVSVAGEEQRFVFQGVHMLFDGRPDRPWLDEKRKSQIVFIGRNLNRNELVEGFKKCLAKEPHLSLK
jgi:G3E family GTPase